MVTTVAVAAAAIIISALSWAYQAIQPPPPKPLGSPGGLNVTSPRIQLRDGRHLAYRESGTPKDEATYRIILVHGFDSSKDSIILPASPELVDEQGVYFLSYDRAGYGESDPNPKKNIKTEAMDIQELADQLEIGSKFYLIGVSMGGFFTWSCLNYIPHRLAGAALVSPGINYWWPSYPADLSRQAFKKLAVPDQRTIWIAHHVPSLLYGWMTQKWFPTLTVASGKPDALTKQDLEIIQKRAAYYESIGFQDKAKQQGVFESLYRDLIVGFSDWEFDPMNIRNPFPDKEGSVQVWQGYEDKLVPRELQRYVAEKLPWVKYRENPEGGHMFIFTTEWTDTVLKSLLLGEHTAST